MGLRNVTSGNGHGVRKYLLSSSYQVDMIKSQNGLQTDWHNFNEKLYSAIVD